MFVSFVQDPSHFFVQVVGPHSVELDRLIEEMTDLYSEDNFREQLGTLTVCIFLHRLIIAELNL